MGLRFPVSQLNPRFQGAARIPPGIIYLHQPNLLTLFNVTYILVTNMAAKGSMREISQLSKCLAVLECAPKKVILSGPSGFLGTHVLDSILDVHEARKKNNLETGEVILLSSSPGNMMKRLQAKYGEKKMKTIRASRVDYFSQHEVSTWRDHMGSLGRSADIDAYEIFNIVFFLVCFGIIHRIEGRECDLCKLGCCCRSSSRKA